jgi:formylglycine-generating enzyme required for sulfatase activity
MVLMAVLLTALGACAWYVLTAHSVVVETDPRADAMKLSGGITPRLAGRYLLRPGTYRLRAEKSGYLPIDTELDVGPGRPAVVMIAFEPLGGVVTITSRPVGEAAVTIDGQAVGATPLEDLALSAGDHAVEVRAPLHLAYSTNITIEPGDPPATLEAELIPNWAPLTVSSSPAGADVLLDRSVVGKTPATIDVEAGTHTLEIRRNGHKTANRSIRIVAGEAVDLGVIALTPEDGRLAVVSEPGGATVTVGSEYRGTTPLDVTVTPGVPLDVRVSLAGHATFSRSVTVASGKRLEVRAILEMLTGEVVITSQPPGAQVLIDGTPRGRTDLTLELDARQHRIELLLDGYDPFRTAVTPEPGLTRAVRATLKPAGVAGLPQTISSPQGTELVLINAGRLTMGAPRREPGRRANEVLREVEITKPFYLAVSEVSNREYREFASGHLSGAYGGHNLEIDHHPVVNVSWQDAARYCNWLSAKAGLPPVYVERAGTLVPRTPLPMGYRLPTEAEWAWAARYAGSASPKKYAWGDSLPVPPGAGNYGDTSAETALHAAVPDYQDGYPATAPVGSFTANKLGLFNLGGNVAEWVQDFYTFTPSPPGVVEKDPTGPPSGVQHVIRGASWMDTAVTELRLTFRDGGDQPRPDLGFRIARSAE